MKHFTRTFFTGRAVTLPVAAPVYILIWAALAAERALDRLLRFVWLQVAYLPGPGVALGVVLVFLVGLLTRIWAARKIWSGTDKLMYRVPLVKTVYGALRDFTDFLSRLKTRGARQVVLARVGDADLRIVGFVTRDDIAGLPPAMSEPGTIMVYLPHELSDRRIHRAGAVRGGTAGGHVVRGSHARHPDRRSQRRGREGRMTTLVRNKRARPL